MSGHVGEEHFLTHICNRDSRIGHNIYSHIMAVCRIREVIRLTPGRFIGKI